MCSIIIQCTLVIAVYISSSTHARCSESNITHDYSSNNSYNYHFDNNYHHHEKEKEWCSQGTRDNIKFYVRLLKKN